MLNKANNFTLKQLSAWYRVQSLQNRSISILTILRFTVSLAFILTIFWIDQKTWLTLDNELLFFKFSFAYFIFSLFCIFLNLVKTPNLSISIPFQITIDIAFIILLMHAVGGVSSGFGVLLIIMIVIGSFTSNGRLALYYGAVASIGLLVEHSIQILLFAYPTISYTQPVLLSLGCFATAWLAHTLNTRMIESQKVASKRGVDLQNMSQINALITQEMQDGVIIIDQSLNIKHSNHQANQLLSLPDSQVSGLTLHSLPDIAKLYLHWVNHQTEASIFNYQFNNHEFKVRFMPIDVAQNPQLSGSVIFIQDWSQLQSKAQQVKLAALGRLTAKIAHEIRNPLSAISHANQLLQEDIVDGNNVRVLEIVEDNIHRIDKIIKDVLELNRRDRTRQQAVELNQFIMDFHHQFCAVEKVDPAGFTLSLLDTPQTALFDHRHLTQILWNLCSNGWEHSKKTTASLQLVLKLVDVNLLHIVITDDGDGVTEENKAKLFEPFFTTKSTGSGLGLYISRELAEANGAALQYQAITEGTAFILQLNQSSS